MISLESSLLYTRPDETQHFVHDTYRDFFLAKYFADRINDGRLSVRDAYVNYWSYEEDKKFWELKGLADEDCRALLPDFEGILPHVLDLISTKKAQNLVDLVKRNYFKAAKLLPRREYNPFERDYEFALHLASKNSMVQENAAKELLEMISSEDKPDVHNLFRYVVTLNYWNSYLLDFIKASLLMMTFEYSHILINRKSMERAFAHDEQAMASLFYKLFQEDPKLRDRIFDFFPLHSKDKSKGTDSFDYDNLKSKREGLEALKTHMEMLLKDVAPEVYETSIESLNKKLDLLEKDPSYELFNDPLYDMIVIEAEPLLTKINPKLNEDLEKIMNKRSYDPFLVDLFGMASRDSLHSFDEINGDVHATALIMGLADYLSRMDNPQIITDLKKNKWVQYDIKNAIIFDVHQHLKPRGFNPDIKRISYPYSGFLTQLYKSIRTLCKLAIN